MNAEALIGRVLGTCTLQKLVGQGGMGAVFLAQQSRPRRQVAVKVLLPITQLNANQLAAFLERFRRETDAAASLEHPNIMPVHEYGEQGGLAYLVMPYVSGGTLRDELEREGPLSLQHTVDYLEQLAAALDFAHEHGVIHRDIKPANIMVTNEGRLLLSDFGLVKIIAEGQTPQVRLTGAGAPVGTPDYMAPEQVIGEEVDTRADLYSLGVILFQMLTGTTPFQGETPMQIAAQHLQIPPPSPQMLRPDLPIAAEQVVLRAMAKRPGDRYMRAQDMARAFRSAVVNAGIRLDPEQTWAGLLSGSTASRLAIPRGQFDPMRQTASMPKVTKADAQSRGNALNRPANNPIPQQPVAEPVLPRQSGGLLGRTNTIPTGTPARPTGGLLSKSGQWPPAGSGAMPTVGAPDPVGAPRAAGGGLLSKTGQFPLVGAGNGLNPAWSKEPPQTPNNLAQNAAFPKTPTNTLTTTEQNGSTGTLKLNDPVKVVKVPVAGQPGRYITGILPFERQAEEKPAEPAPVKPGLKPWMRNTIALVIVCVVLASIAGGLLFSQHQNTTQGNQQTNTTAAGNAANDPATMASATANANVLVSDPLSKNINGWRTDPANLYAFKGNAYHIAVQNNKGSGAILPQKTFDGPLTYRITMQEVKGDDNDPNNTFGMLLRFNQQQKNGKTNTTFYTFEVTNVKGKEYQFWRYDDSQQNPWIQVKNGTLPTGNEFHQGKQANTIAIAMNGDRFTVTVNGKKLSKVFQDGTYKNGSVGMIVNKDGTEVAFTNLLLTRN
ncbi:hypothetical protein KDH_41930 [Dictyobacter sp. S3.2.2.5]|uniref:non-specific serine/threonine protein kinase n=1 Tax=Dictyobacter halimunensis TaxID=3026934 RepID=A0ABQ6FSY7_9CHLR|nr:hypothetical protein KDH_41930 [Dictyobacter sp. S3.2.2.5]